MGFSRSNGALKRKRYILLLAFLLCSRSFGTTAVFISAPGQIIAGTDRLGADLDVGAVTTNPQTITKIVLLQGRFIIASIGIESVRETARPERALYNFIPWIRGIEAQISPDTSISGLVSIVEKESAHTFRDVVPVEAQMKNGTLKHNYSLDKFLVHYVVAGFDNGITTIIEVYYELDWKENRLVGPMRKIVLPQEGVAFSVDNFGRTCAIAEAENSHSYAYKRMRVFAPLAFNKLLARTKLQPQEGIRAVRALIGIQAEVEPDYVGRGSTVVVLPLNAAGSVIEYRDSLTLTDPKPGSTNPNKKLGTKAQQ